MQAEVMVALSAGALAIISSRVLSARLKAKSAGTKKMRSVSSAVREGAFAYLKREYQVIASFAALALIAVYFLLGWKTAAAFACGAILSAFIGFIGMNNSTRANVRTAQAAEHSLQDALETGFSSGLITSLFAVGLGLIGVSLSYEYLGLEALFGFGAGASSVALFARVGGGVYTKAADVGADLVGKVEKGIPEDDPRNPAVIADNVGDNVGDVAGVSADLFESYAGAIIAAMALGSLVGPKELLLPLLLGVTGLGASLLGTLFLKSAEPEKALRNASSAASIFSIAFAFFLVTRWMGGGLEYFYAIAIGVVAGSLISFSSEYYTSPEFGPTQRLAESATTGPATVILNGFSLGLKSAVPAIAVICLGVLASHYSAGLYGVGLAAVGMLSTLGLSLAADAYGPVVDNAGGIVEMAGLKKKVRERTDALDSAGNTTKAIGKGFAVGSAALTALAFYSVYSSKAGLEAINLMDAGVVAGLFAGGAIAFLFAALTIQAVEKAAFELVGEVRRQFKQSPAILKGKKKPDYAKCVDIATVASLKEMVLPAAIAIGAPITFGFLLGKAALGGLLAGALVAGVLIGVVMANSGGAWDNAKKFVEAGNYGGKGGYAHKAAVIGDTVGDPFKDTSGPAMNILVKLMSMVALLFASGL